MQYPDMTRYYMLIPILENAEPMYVELFLLPVLQLAALSPLRIYTYP